MAEGHRPGVTFIPGAVSRRAAGNDLGRKGWLVDAAELRRRLRVLGAGGKKAARQRAAPPRALVNLPPGEELPGARGTAYRLQRQYPRDHLHGNSRLCRLLDFPVDLLERVAGGQWRLARLEGLAFIDTETTGLAGGAGTLVFLVGIGTFTSQGFLLRQYFLRDPREEPAMLEHLARDLEEAEGFVTYNGRAFDLPLLEGRYVIALRQRLALLQRPHLDLLFPARRLWRRQLPDCRLATVERHILAVQRGEQDVPGALIPSLYQHYLRTGDAREMARVIYHNQVDVLSLVGLTAQVLSRHQDSPDEALTAGEALALARWHARHGRAPAADRAFRLALRAGFPQLRRAALRGYSFFLKGQGRRAQAVEPWQAWHALDPSDPVPCVELAKYYEWEAGDLQAALRWTERGLNCLAHWPPGWRREEARAELDHRLRRLERKLARAARRDVS